MSATLKAASTKETYQYRKFIHVLLRTLPSQSMRGPTELSIAAENEKVATLFVLTLLRLVFTLLRNDLADLGRLVHARTLSEIGRAHV